MKNMKLFSLLTLLIVVGLAFTGCKKHNHKDHDHGDHGHHHKAPHDGTLVVLGGDHFAHLEFKLDEKKGELTAWVLDGHAEMGPKAEQKEITLKITPHGKKESFEVVLVGVNPLDDKKMTEFVSYQATSDKLKRVKEFDGVITMVKIKGKEMKDVKFPYPGGNEKKEDNHKDHDH